MSDGQWVAKSELAALLDVSERTVQRRIGQLEAGPNSRHVRRDGNRVLISAQAVQEGLLGATVGELEERNELLERTASALSDDNDRLRQQLEVERLHSTVANQQGTIAAQENEIEALRTELGRVRSALHALVGNSSSDLAD